MANKKTVKVVLEDVKQEEKSLWQKVKDFFYNSEAAFLAWVTGVIGTVTAVVSGVLASTDFSSILTMFQSGLSFTKQQLMIMGFGALAMGGLQYWARVRGTKAVNGQLLPKAN